MRPEAVRSVDGGGEDELDIAADEGGCLRLMRGRALQGMGYVCVEEVMVGLAGGMMIWSTLLV